MRQRQLHRSPLSSHVPAIIERLAKESTFIMSDNSKEDLDRRDFLIASIATAGASAGLAINIDAASAQGTSASSAGAAPAAREGTIYAGDVIEGRRSSAPLT